MFINLYRIIPQQSPRKKAFTCNGCTVADAMEKQIQRETNIERTCKRETKTERTCERVAESERSLQTCEEERHVFSEIGTDVNTNTIRAAASNAELNMGQPSSCVSSLYLFPS